MSDFIVVDQFGYRTTAMKKAIVKHPITGFDASQSFIPGTSYALINSATQETVFTATLIPWKNGTEDEASGDKVWYFDFTNVTTVGNYYILDISQNVRSFEFEIRDDVYNEVLKQAMRTFYYQRVGFAKEPPFADAAWADAASHIGPLQDTEARKYNSPSDAGTERDVSGGWYDAGDFNKYTPWTSGYVYELLKAYEENPKVWTDDYNIPESGNGIPDILDEVRWGMDHLLRLQNSNGSLISVIGESHASPPSSANGQSLYGGVNTVSALGAAGAFAYGSKVYEAIGMTSYAATLEQAAIAAWDWADANPSVEWRNNDATNGSQGIGAGQQETNDYGRLGYKLRAATHLFEITNNAVYKNYFDANYQRMHLFEWTFAFPFESREQDALLYYTKVPNATTNVVSNIKDKYDEAMRRETNIQAYNDETDAYMSYLKDYTWGSNNIKSIKGLMFYNMLTYDIDASINEDVVTASEQYIHYIHGLNPLNIVYLSNMYDYGGDQCVNQFYHTWFVNGSPLWDEVGVSTYGPAPGFLTGGPNPSYSVDGCCPNNCGSSGNNALCASESLTPPTGQPDSKSYKDFNTSWPLNSWEVTENSCGYQVSYIRLLSKFVAESSVTTSLSKPTPSRPSYKVFPNPAKNSFSISGNIQNGSVLRIYDQLGSLKLNQILSNQVTQEINVSNFPSGVYIVNVGGTHTKVIIE